MITPRVVIDTQSIERQIAFLEVLPEILEQTALDVAADFEEPVINDLSETPGKVKYPIEWTSEKQRRFVMAKLRAENNLPYQRTGRKPYGWQMNVEASGGTVTIVIRNIWNAARFVFGALLGDPAASGADQQKFHKNTGWQLAQPKINRWFYEMNKAMLERYNARVEQERKR